MVELPEAWEPVVKALLRAPIAWQTPAQIAEALGRDVEETADLLCLMNVACWIDVWDAEPEPRVTLSPLAAERLRIHLVEIGASETPRWARAGDPLPPRPKARNVSRLERSAALDIVPDPGPSPDQEAERFEQADRRSARSRGGAALPGPRPELPFPTLLLGQGLSPWPGPARQSIRPCPACGGRPLRSHEYCLCCDRWGLDSLLPAAVRSRPARPTGPHQPHFQPVDPTRRERLAAEREREKRKDRRAAKLQAKIEAERLRKQNPGSPQRDQDQSRNGGPNPASDKARS